MYFEFEVIFMVKRGILIAHINVRSSSLFSLRRIRLNVHGFTFFLWLSFYFWDKRLIGWLQETIKWREMHPLGCLPVILNTMYVGNGKNALLLKEWQFCIGEGLEERTFQKWEYMYLEDKAQHVWKTQHKGLSLA